jgi:very-short-patch-repair endonuclease
MFHAELSQRAKRLIKERTYESPIEEIIGNGLKEHGIPIRLQEPIGPYFADIFLPDLNLVIECDGKQHTYQREYDQKRDNYMIALGYRVIRMSGKEILSDSRAAIYKIVKYIYSFQISPFAKKLADKMDVSYSMIREEEFEPEDTPENWDKQCIGRLDRFEKRAEYAD